MTFTTTAPHQSMPRQQVTQPSHMQQTGETHQTHNNEEPIFALSWTFQMRLGSS